MQKPLVSILICCYNRGALLGDTIESVLAQHYQPVEIIVVDDGSTDHTREVVARFGDRIRYLYQSNQGIAVARTTACELARGELIAFQDDDDLMPANRLLCLQGALATYPQCVFAVGDMAYMDSEGKLTGSRWLPRGRLSDGEPLLISEAYEAVIWPRIPATPHTTLFRRERGEEVGWFDRRYQFASEDKDFFARLGKLGPIVYVPEIVSLYRRGHQSLTGNQLRTEYGQLRFLVDHLRECPAGAAALRKRLRNRVRRGLCTIRRLETRADARFGDPGECRALRREALSQLGLGEKTRYWWEAVAKNPLKSFARPTVTPQDR